MKPKTYDEAMDHTFKFLMFGCTVATFQLMPLLLAWFTHPGYRFITKWLFLFPATAWGITFIVFAVMMFRVEFGTHFHGNRHSKIQNKNNIHSKKRSEEK